MIGFIKKLFSGILSFLFGLLGGKKSEKKLAANNPKGRKRNGYFMELDESEENQPAVNGTQSAKAESAKTPQPVAAAKSAIADAKSAITEKTAAAKSAVTERVEAAKPAKAEKTADAKPAKAEKTADAKPAKAEKTADASNEAAKKVELVQTAEGVKAQPAKPAKAPAASANGQAKTETTFAPKYLNPANSSNGRRRPGPNMSTFLDMARQVKTPG